jgi:hypothetical protein
MGHAAISTRHNRNDSFLFCVTHIFGQFRRASWLSVERAMLIPETKRLQVLTDSFLIRNDPMYVLLHAQATFAK